MKRFSFNLEKLLGLRRHREEEAEIELGRAVGALQEIENRLKALAAERFRAASLEFAGNRVEDIISYERYLNRLDADTARNEKAAALAELKVEEARDAYLEASRERKVLSKLEEKRRAEYRKEAAAEEVKAVDDISGAASGQYAEDFFSRL